jgi:hypothetical protein
MLFNLHEPLPWPCLAKPLRFFFWILPQGSFPLIVIVSIPLPLCPSMDLPYTTWLSSHLVLWCKCASSLKLEVFQGLTFIFEGQCPYWEHLRAFCLLLLIFISILWTLFNWNFSTISSRWSKCPCFTHWDSLQWHPFHLTRYCLHVCLVCLTPRYIQPH